MKVSEKYITISQKEYASLRQGVKEVKELRGLTEELLNRTTIAFARIELLEKEAKEYRKVIANFKGEKLPQKNSSNSHIPPSKDLYRVDTRRSLRKKSNKKTGGQKGHKGSCLEFSNNPDKTIDLMESHCINCGSVLNSSEAIFKERRQLIDVPFCKSKTYQYNAYEVVCVCGCKNKASYPDHIKAPVQYGPNIRSLINYFSVRQFVPFKRLREVMKDCFGVKLSEGFIYNTLERSAKKAKGIHDHIKSQIAVSDWVGTDETTIFRSGLKNTLWVWQNKNYTYLSTSDSRHQKHIKDLFYHGFPNAILSSDQYAAHLSTKSNGHQICWAHLQRKIEFLLEVQDYYWLKKLKGIYKKARRLKKLHSKYGKGSPIIGGLVKDLNRLLLQKLGAKTHPLIKAFQKSLKKNRAYLLTFLYHAEVPADNNSSEQAIRNAKVKMKVSGGFKSLQQAYAVMRSVIDTSIKNDLNILHTIKLIETGEEVSFV